MSRRSTGIKEQIVANDERATDLIFRTCTIRRAWRRTPSARKCSRPKEGGATIDDVRHLVAGERGRAVYEEGDPDSGIWSAGMVQGLIHDIPTVRNWWRASSPKPKASSQAHGRHGCRACDSGGVTRLRAWEVQDAWSIDNLRRVERDAPAVAPGQVVVRIRAASINYRDLLTVEGKGGTRRLPLIPFVRRSGRSHRDRRRRDAGEDRRPRLSDVLPRLDRRAAGCEQAFTPARRTAAGRVAGSVGARRRLGLDGAFRLVVRGGGDPALRRPHGLARADGREANSRRADRAGAGHRRRVDLRVAVREDARRARDRDVVVGRKAGSCDGARRRRDDQLHGRTRNGRKRRSS